MPPFQDDYRPHITNLRDGEVVFDRLVLVHGTVGPVGRFVDASIRVDGSGQFAPQMWQVTDGYFKALVPLSPGPQTLRFSYVLSPCPIPTPSNLPSLDPSWPFATLNVTYTPRPHSSPLHLAVLVAKDSELKVDCPPERRGIDDGLDVVLRKFALQAYMWQAYTAEQMRRHGLGRRSFRFDEVDNADIVQDIAQLPKIHILRSQRTMKEIREKDNAQQYQGAKRGAAMLDFTVDVLESPSCPPEILHDNGAHVACLTLDTQWDPRIRLLRGHAAVGFGGPGQGLKVGVCGSHWIHAAPRGLEEVTMRFLDEGRTDERFCVNDLGECGTNWETLNIGSGAFLHETGHAFNNPHHPSGIMARGYQEWNRAFMTREGHSTRTGSRFKRPITDDDSDLNHWHRLAAIRFRFHPSFRLPSDPPLPSLREPRFQGPQGWKTYLDSWPSWQPVDEGIVLSCAAGIALVEVEVDDQFKSHVEWPFVDPQSQPAPPTSILITPQYLSQRIGRDAMSCKVTMKALATNHNDATLPDFRGASERMLVQGVEGPVVKGVAFGQESENPRLRWMVPLPSAFGRGRGPRLTRVTVQSGACLDGISFKFADGSRIVVGSDSGGSPHHFDLQADETVEKLHVRSGAWLDAVQVVTSSGRVSPMYGGTGGGLRTIEPPPGHTLVGLYGSSMDGGGGRLGWTASLGGLYQRL